MNHYKLVIFDFDGTLADSARWLRGVVHELAARHGFRAPTDQEFDSLRGKNTLAILEHLGVSMWKVPFIARHLREMVARDAHAIALFDGIAELLAALTTRGVAVAVVSSNAEDNVRRILGPANAARVQHFACGAGLFGKGKKFREVLARVGVRPDEAIAIGDEVRDIEAARGEGIAAGSVTWGYATSELLRAHNPTVLFESVRELYGTLVPTG